MMGPAGQLIEKGWAQKAFAYNEHNEKVSTDAGDACRFCAQGAVYRAYPVESLEAPPVPTLALLAHLPPDANLAQWNDDPKRTHEEVIELFRKAGI